VAWRRQGPALLWRRQKELVGLFVILGGTGSTVLICIAPVIYRRLLGVEFTDAVLPFQILVIGRLVVFVGQIFAWSMAALHLDRQFFWASLAGAVFSVCINVMSIPRYGIIGAALVSSLSEVIVCGTCFLLVRRELTRQEVRFDV